VKRTFGMVLMVGLAFGCAQVIGIQDAKLEDASTDAPQSLCELYCSKVMEFCTGGLQVYAKVETCMLACEKFPPGQSGDVSGNSVECRLRNAELADTTGEPQTHCPAAGPGGNGGCGSNCEGSCTLMLATCPGFFASSTECESACAAVPDMGGFNVSQQSGNSMQCRLYHVSAAQLDPTTHCPHAAGMAICVP
jgi:hypothetical protein